MKEIPEEIINDVNKITEEILKYQNKNNLSWTQSYREILKKLNMHDKLNNNNLLSCVITQITKLGYDIEGIPFKLTKYN